MSKSTVVITGAGSGVGRAAFGEVGEGQGVERALVHEGGIVGGQAGFERSKIDLAMIAGKEGELGASPESVYRLTTQPGALLPS